MPSRTTWLLIGGAALAGIAVVALSGKKGEKKEEDQDAMMASLQQGQKLKGGRYMPTPELAQIWGPGPWSTLQRTLVEKYIEQTGTRKALTGVFPGLAYLHDWMKKRKIPLVLDIGFEGIRKNLQYGPPSAKRSPSWETDLDSAMLKSGMAIRLSPTQTVGYHPELGPPSTTAVFRGHQEADTNKIRAWNAFMGEYEDFPILEVPKGVVKIDKRGAQAVRDALVERYPSGMAYGDSDRILYVISTYDGANRQALKVGPQNEIGRARLSGSFPPFDETVDAESVLAKEGGTPITGLLEDPEGWLEEKKQEGIDAGTDYLADKAEGVLSDVGSGLASQFGL